MAKITLPQALRKTGQAIRVLLYPPKGICAGCGCEVAPDKDECGDCWAARQW